MANLPIIIFQYLDPTGEVGNQYVPYFDINKAADDLRLNLQVNKSDEQISVYINPDHRDEIIKKLEAIANDVLGRDIVLYRITPGVLNLAR